MKIKYDDYIYGYSTCGDMRAKIINWEFEEKIDYSRFWVKDKINMLMMYIIIKTDNGTYINDFFSQKSELTQIIREELRLNLKLQQGVLK